MYKKSLLLVIVFISMISCSIPSNTTTSSYQEKLDVQFKKLDQKTGAKNIRLASGFYKGKQLRVVIPKKNTQTRKPLIIALHWAGTGEVFKEYSQCLVEPAFENEACYLIIPDAEGMVWTNQYNENKILQLIELAKKNWNVNPSKIIITGYSNGGNGAWFFADKHADLIQAAIPMASAYPINKKVKIPLYVIHGQNDELFALNKTKKWTNNAIKKGSSIVFAVVPNYSHYMACMYVKELKKAVEWLNLDKVK